MRNCIIRIFLLCALLASQQSFAQQVKFMVITPVAGELISNEDLLISLRIDEGYHFASSDHVQVFLDDKLISGIAKVRDNRLDFLYIQSIRSGKHKIKIEAKIAELNKMQSVDFEIYVGKKKSKNVSGDAGTGQQLKETVSLDGMLSIDNRSVALSGSGQGLRQEPAYTRTLNLDAVARYKGIELPVKVFLTSDNSYAQQDRNYFQVGLRTKWLELSAGDLNPVFDKLVLTGVRIRGAGLALKHRASSLQLYYGDMTNALEGSLGLYTPGTGVLPTNLINDSQYVISGIYRRTMMAARLELAGRKERVKLGFSAFKGKDDIKSIQYGLDPKDNVAGGLDLTLRMLRRKLTIEAGVAASIYTKDISNGPISKEALDTAYNQKPPFDPVDYENIIVLNSSTMPNNLASLNNIAWYSQVNYTNKYQALTVEYKKNGADYYSLGNPFLRNNYEGLSAKERFSLFRKRLTVGLGYQNYANSLNEVSSAMVRTEGFNGNLFINPGGRWPTFVLNYVNQKRNGESEIENIPGIKDILSNYMFNVSLSRKFWNIDHHFRFVLNVSNREDLVRAQNKFKVYNGVLSIGETFLKKININVELGKALIQGGLSGSETISDVNIYSLSGDWQINTACFTGLSVSNYKNQQTTLSGESYRLSVIGRFGYIFWRGMRIDLEGGYLPYRDQVNDNNSYDELYGYVRYSCELRSLFARQ